MDWSTQDVIQPVIGPGDLTRQEAVARIQSILDLGVVADAELSPVAELWRRGAKDLTVFHGACVWAVYPHRPGCSEVAAVDWVEDFVRLLRGSGVVVWGPRL